jgi:putative transposase
MTQQNLRTHGRAHVILLSRDLTLASAPLVDD